MQVLVFTFNNLYVHMRKVTEPNTPRACSLSDRLASGQINVSLCVCVCVCVYVCVCVPGMSGVSGAALWEVSCINRSLSALSDVLGALAEQRPHVPYRNSKLTHLLQDAIGETHTHIHTHTHTLSPSLLYDL